MCACQHCLMRSRLSNRSTHILRHLRIMPPMLYATSFNSYPSGSLALRMFSQTAGLRSAVTRENAATLLQLRRLEISLSGGHIFLPTRPFHSISVQNRLCEDWN